MVAVRQLAYSPTAAAASHKHLASKSLLQSLKGTLASVSKTVSLSLQCEQLAC